MNLLYIHSGKRELLVLTEFVFWMYTVYASPETWTREGGERKGRVHLRLLQSQYLFLFLKSFIYNKTTFEAVSIDLLFWVSNKAYNINTGGLRGHSWRMEGEAGEKCFGWAEVGTFHRQQELITSFTSKCFFCFFNNKKNIISVWQWCYVDFVCCLFLTFFHCFRFDV